jgi:hypothetical protein
VRERERTACPLSELYKTLLLKGLVIKAAELYFPAAISPRGGVAVCSFLYDAPFA